MSDLHIRHIKALLAGRFVGAIDLSDMRKVSESRAEAMKLSRALTAFTLASLADCSDEQAISAIVDGFGDNGIDAIHYDSQSSRLYLVQGKWSEKGNAVSSGDVEKFIAGATELLRGDLDAFNDRVKAKEKQIIAALSRADTEIVLVLAHNSVQAPSQDATRRVDRFLEQVNDAGEVATYECVGQRELHLWVSAGNSSAPLDLEIGLQNWGHIREPTAAYYGSVAAPDIARWWAAHRGALFAKNIRRFMADSSINLQIQETLRADPEKFWYFNNGVTLLCRSIRKKPIGGTRKELGIFECTDVSVVNGAQTVGTIGRASTLTGVNLADATVLVRIVSLEGANDDFARAVTRSTNTQNRVTKRDFASLDRNQERLASEMRFEGVAYLYKAGQTADECKQHCTIDEATIAQACAHEDLRLAVVAKGQLGSLWEDIEKAPYKLLFNTGTTGDAVWNRVQVLREVEDALKAAQRTASGKALQVAIHGNRFVLRQVFRFLREKELDPLAVRLDELAQHILDLSVQAAEEALQDLYLAWTFKSQSKCERLEKHLTPALLERPYAVSPRPRGAIAIDPSGQTELPFGLTTARTASAGIPPQDASRGVIDPRWSIEEAVSAASTWYTPGGLVSGPARNAAIESWAAVVGRERASQELQRVIRECGSETAAAKHLSMSVPTLRRFRHSFSMLLDRDDL